MPGLNGLEALRRIRKASPATEILVFTVHGADGMVGELLAAGAKGYLLKSDAARCILPAVEALSRHRPYFTEHVSEVLLGRFLRPDAPAALGAPVEPPKRLTPREREIVQLLAEGSGTKEIARRLGVGTETVRTHRAAVMKKLGVHSVVEVVRYAVRNGLTPI
jgi:DNA-binding NarL/FixJ family response regulator